MGKRIDLAGMKFNRLYVERYRHTKNGRAFWVCKCECGSNVTLDTARIKSGHTKSCGCLNEERKRELGRGVGQVKYPKMNSEDWKIYSQYRNQKKANFGVSEQQIRDMMDRQVGCCGICSRSLDHINGVTFHIDHDHNTKAIRGLLCSKCNKGLGCFEDNKDSLQEAIEYLRRSDG